MVSRLLFPTALTLAVASFSTSIWAAPALAEKDRCIREKEKDIKICGIITFIKRHVVRIDVADDDKKRTLHTDYDEGEILKPQEKLSTPGGGPKERLATIKFPWDNYYIVDQFPEVTFLFKADPVTGEGCELHVKEGPAQITVAKLEDFIRPRKKGGKDCKICANKGECKGAKSTTANGGGAQVRFLEQGAEKKITASDCLLCRTPTLSLGLSSTLLRGIKDKERTKPALRIAAATAIVVVASPERKRSEVALLTPSRIVVTANSPNGNSRILWKAGQKVVVEEGRVRPIEEFDLIHFYKNNPLGKGFGVGPEHDRAIQSRQSPTVRDTMTAVRRTTVAAAAVQQEQIRASDVQSSPAERDSFDGSTGGGSSGPSVPIILF